MVSVGDLFRERYRVIEKVRQAPSSTVYLAMDDQTREVVAVKVFEGISQFQKFQPKFRAEALKLSQLDDKHVVRMITFGFERDSSFLLTEYVAGKTLAEILQERDRLPVAEALRVVQQIGTALEAVRKKVRLHGLLNPYSVLCDTRNNYRLDYDIVGAALAAQGIDAVSREMARYESPEQIEDRDELDSRAEMYSLGIMLFEMISGRVPYDGDDSGQIVSKHLEADTPVLSLYVPESPVEVEELIEQCLQKSRDKRPKSLSSLIQRISRISLESSSSTGSERSRSQSKRSDGVSSPATLVSAKGVVYLVPASKRLIRIGRRDEKSKILPDIDLTNEDPARHVSRRHAQIVVDGDRLYLVEEAGVRSPTAVNAHQLKPGERILLKNGDVIKVAGIELTFKTDR